MVHSSQTKTVYYTCVYTYLRMVWTNGRWTNERAINMVFWVALSYTQGKRNEGKTRQYNVCTNEWNSSKTIIETRATPAVLRYTQRGQTVGVRCRKCGDPAAINCSGGPRRRRRELGTVFEIRFCVQAFHFWQLISEPRHIHTLSDLDRVLSQSRFDRTRTPSAHGNSR